MLTEEQVQQLIDDALSGFDHEVFVVVDTLPAPEDAIPNKIYLLVSGGAVEIYIVVDGEWVLNGSGGVDLTGYWNSTNLQALTQAEILDILDAE